MIQSLSETNQLIQTPYGYFESDWVAKNLKLPGIKWDYKAENWLIMTNEKQGCLITSVFNNLWVAIKQVQEEKRIYNLTQEILELAIAKDYQDKYLPTILGFSSYSTLMKHYNF